MFAVILSIIRDSDKITQQMRKEALAQLIFAEHKILIKMDIDLQQNGKSTYTILIQYLFLIIGYFQLSVR